MKTNQARKGSTTKKTTIKGKASKGVDRSAAAKKAWATMRKNGGKSFDPGAAARKAWITIRKNRKAAAKAAKATSAKRHTPATTKAA
jgi:hypothetical protein